MADGAKKQIFQVLYLVVIGLLLVSTGGSSLLVVTCRDPCYGRLLW